MNRTPLLVVCLLSLISSTELDEPRQPQVSSPTPRSIPVPAALDAPAALAPSDALPISESPAAPAQDRHVALSEVKQQYTLARDRMRSLMQERVELIAQGDRRGAEPLYREILDLTTRRQALVARVRALGRELASRP